MVLDRRYFVLCTVSVSQEICHKFFRATTFLILKLLYISTQWRRKKKRNKHPKEILILCFLHLLSQGWGVCWSLYQLLNWFLPHACWYLFYQPRQIDCWVNLHLSAIKSGILCWCKSNRVRMVRKTQKEKCFF